MKKFYSTCIFTLLLFSYETITAQYADVPVRFAAGNFITGNNIQRQSFQKEDLQASLFNDDYYVLVQFSKLPSAQLQKDLRNAGLDLETYIPGNAYLATIKNSFDLTRADQYQVISINNIPAFYKIDKALADYKGSDNPGDKKFIAVSYYTSLNKAGVIAELQKAGALIMPTKFTETNVVFIQFDADKINAIAELPFVSYISLQNLTDKLLNYKSIGKHAVTSLLSASGKNLSGKGIVVGVGDNSELITQHIDFNDRVINRISFPYSFHGLHVSGTVAGAGLLDQRYRGMAPRATIVSQYLSDIITAAPTYVNDYNMVVTNNSYTNAEDSCDGSGAYDVTSNYVDKQMGDYPKLLHVFSAGNDGRNTCSPYPYSYATIKSGYQVAKNVLTVGAVDTLYAAATFSSRGPVDDGRLKPEIMATGYLVNSTRHLFGYGTSSGTSMSGPIVAGVATVLNEQYRKSNAGALPQAALIKAVICNAAEDLGNPGPDFIFGFGNLNARRAAEAIENNRFYISSTAPSSNTIVVPAGARRLKVMLYWNDTAAAPNAATALVNDFDLTVVAPGNITHLPLVLDPTPANVNNNAVEGIDRLNNIEQVVIDNPVAGNYDINVNAFALPYGPREYVVTYQIDTNGVTVEYPFGEEKMVPGEVEVIRWNAYGDESNTFTLEYYDGSSWNLIDANVPADRQSYNWLVPSTVSNDYLVRVSRNSSAYTNQSDFSFTVIGQPVVTATVPCEGFVQLDWPAISGATSYDIWQMKSDTMAIIGNTTSLSYLITGLSSTTTYWFGVSAKNGTVNGRRSLSKSVLPATGTCTLSMFDNNVKAVSIDAPVTGRQFTSSSLTAAEPIKFTIKNLDNVATSGSYDLYYQVNGGATVIESSSVVIPALGSRQHTFATTANFSAPGIYNIKAWVKRTGDTQVLDDTISVTIKQLANVLISLPVVEGFENAITKEYTSNTIGLDSIDRVDFKANSVRGRARTFVNTGFSHNGTKAITLDQFPVGPLNTDSLIMTYNLANYTSGQQLRLDFYYKNHGNENQPNNKVWIRASDTSPWIFAYDLIANQAALGQYKHGIINVNDVLDTVVPAQTISSSFQVKFGHQGFTSANMPDPILDQDDGYTFDDVGIKEVTNDIGITRILSPAISGCGLAGSQPVSFEIKNYSSTTFTNVPVYYNVNAGGAVMEIIASLPPGLTIHTFAIPENLLVNTDYSFNFWINEPTDNYKSNDSVLNYNFHTAPVISTFPYLEGFESGDGSWYSKGQNSSWQWGTPANSIIDKAANGSKAWVTNLTGRYNTNEISYLYSPCFNLSGLTQPVLSFSHIFQVEDGVPADYNWIEYSVNGGVTWSRLGTNGAGTNWYNDPTGKNQWRPSLTTWHVASIDIPTTANNVRFRFVMTSDLGYNLEGVGIDDIHIFEKRLIYTGAQITGITQTVNGSGWVDFNSGTGRRVASINANGNSLGNTTVDVYPYTGTVRVQNNQYYLNRNIVIRPTTQPGGDVSVRFYFTDAEAKSLLAATGCAGCTVTKDPYVLGVTKYSGNAAVENGTLADNSNFYYSFILPANTEIIPYDNGYYAEFPVNSFSEFWLNNGGVGGTHPLPVGLLSFEAIKQAKKVLLQWITENESNADKYTVERSEDGITYSAIGTVTAFNSINKNNYSFTDMQPLPGFNFYRLKMVDKNASFLYSDIRKVNFNNAGDDITIYPNPVVNSKIFVASTGNANTAVLFDVTGKTVRTFKLQGRNNSLDLSGIAKGVYQLKIFTDNIVHSEKISIQ